MREVLGVGFLAAVSLIMGLFARTKAGRQRGYESQRKIPRFMNGSRSREESDRRYRRYAVLLIALGVLLIGWIIVALATGSWLILGRQ